MPTGHHVRQQARTQMDLRHISSEQQHIWKQNTGINSTFSLHISNFIKEAFEARTNIRIHTDGSAAKSITMKEGASKKAKRIELRHLFIQQLVKRKIFATHNVMSEDSPAHTLTKFVGCDTLSQHMYTVGLPSFTLCTVC